MPVPVHSRYERSQSPPSIMITPSRSNYVRSTSNNTTSYTPTIVSNGAQSRLNIVSRVAVEGRVRKGQDSAPIKVFLKLSIPIDSVTPGSTIPLFPEDNVKVITSKVHPLNSNSVPYNFSSSSSPLLHAAARALNLPARSAEYFPASTSTPKRSGVDSNDIPLVEPHYTGSIVVSQYNVAFVLPKVFITPDEQSETDHPKSPLHRRRMSVGERQQVHFMAAIDMIVPLASRPPRAPYLLVIPTPRCLHNHIKLRIFPPVMPSASFASLSSVEEDGNMWDLTSDPHVTRTPSVRSKRTGSYTQFADDESSESSGQGISEGCIIQGTFPSSEKIRIRWAKPIKNLHVPGMDRSGRRRAGVEEVKGEMTCVVLGKGSAASNPDLEGVLMSVEYQGQCKGVWFPGVATLLGLDVGLQAKNSDISWPANYSGIWQVSGETGYTGFDHGSPSKPPNSRSASMESQGSIVVDPEILGNNDSIKSHSASLLRAPLPSSVGEYSFEGSSSTLPTSSLSPSNVSSLPAASTTAPATDCSPGSPITLHLNVSELKPPPNNIFCFKISGTILVTSRASSSRLGASESVAPAADPDPIVLPRFTVLAADTEATSIVVRNEAENTSVEVFHPTGDIYSDPQTRKTVLQKDSSTRCGEEGGRIALKSFDAFGNTFARPTIPRPRTPSNNMVPKHSSPSPQISRATVSSRGKPEGPSLIPFVYARITPIAQDRLSALPTGYAVRICLRTPSLTETEWLEFGMTSGTKASTEVDKIHPRLTLICASVDGVPVKAETSRFQLSKKAAVSGAPFEELTTHNWAYWGKVFIGPIAGRELIFDYVVREAEPGSGKGKKSSSACFNALLPAFFVSTARLEVEIDPLPGLQVTGLTSNFDYHYQSSTGDRLLMYSVEGLAPPQLTFSFRKSRSQLYPAILNLLASLWWAVFCALAVYLQLRFFALDRPLSHSAPSIGLELEPLTKTTTFTTTIYQTTTISHSALITPTSSTLIQAQPTTLLSSSATIDAHESLSTVTTTTTSAPVAVHSNPIVSAPDAVSEQTYHSFLKRFGLYSLDEMFNIDWSFEEKYDTKKVVEKMTTTLETVWRIVRKVYHYPLDPP